MNEHHSKPIVNKEIDTNGTCTVWLDSPDRSVNVMDLEMVAGLESAIDEIHNESIVQTVVFRSRKPDCFIAGADVHTIAQLSHSDTHDPDAIRSIISRGQQLMQRITELTPTTIAVIDGSCLGGGLELALVCDIRLASDSPKTRLGAPEIKLGLIPAWGGTQRLPKLVGLQQALKMILKGSTLSAKKAKRVGLVDEIFDKGQIETLINSANFKRRRPRNSIKNFIFDHTGLGRWLAFRTAEQSTAQQSKHYPALPKAIEAIKQAYDSNSDGFEFEAHAFSELLFTPTAQNLIRIFLDRDAARNLKTWTDQLDTEPAAVNKVAVIGAGTMGAGIGALAAIHGNQVSLKEVNEAARQAGSDRIEKLIASQLRQGRISEKENEAVLDRIKTTIDWTDIKDCDLAIEAVPEVDKIKRAVFQMLDRQLPDSTTLASNTSALSVTELANATTHPSSVGGLHFFNPVERMELVEVVRTTKTDAQTLARLIYWARSMGKTPVVTLDRPGFVVNRILFPYLDQAVRNVANGGDVLSIDNNMKQFGMPMGPLELIDQVGVDVAAQVAQTMTKPESDSEQTTSDGNEDSSIDQTPDTRSILDEMVQRGWLGKKEGVGFYHWPMKTAKGKRKQIHRELIERLQKNKQPASTDSPPIDAVDANPARSNWMKKMADGGINDVQSGLLYPMLLESVRCYHKSVVKESWMIDLAMILGTGFAPWTGGPLRLLDSLGIDWRNKQSIPVLSPNFKNPVPHKSHH